MRLNILSIDIEDWYISYDSSQIETAHWPQLESRVEVNTRLFLEILSQHRQKATFFVLGWIAEQHPALIKEIADAGHEIGYHSYLHEVPANMGAEAFEADLVKGLDLLESITGVRPVQYRAPMFSLCGLSAWVIPILIRHGIRISSSYKSGQQINGGKVPNAPFRFSHEGGQLIELPLNRLNLPLLNAVYTGSGYFRILPLGLINQLYDRSSYNMAYFHPRDFDVNQPSSNLLPAYRNRMNRMGNSSTRPKLEDQITTWCYVVGADSPFTGVVSKPCFKSSAVQ